MLSNFINRISFFLCEPNDIILVFYKSSWFADLKLTDEEMFLGLVDELEEYNYKVNYRELYKILHLYNKIAARILQV